MINDAERKLKTSAGHPYWQLRFALKSCEQTNHYYRNYAACVNPTSRLDKSIRFVVKSTKDYKVESGTI